MAKAGVLTTVKSGPHRIVYRVRLPEATIYIKHFLVPNRRAVLRQWVRRGKGRNEGKRSVHLADDRRADDHAGCARRAAKTKIPVRELPGHAGDFRHDSARRVRREPAAGVARAEAIEHPPEARPGRRRDDGPAPQCRAIASRLSSRQHPGARAIRPKSPSSS